MAQDRRWEGWINLYVGRNGEKKCHVDGVALLAAGPGAGTLCRQYQSTSSGFMVTTEEKDEQGTATYHSTQYSVHSMILARVLQ